MLTVKRFCLLARVLLTSQSGFCSPVYPILLVAQCFFFLSIAPTERRSPIQWGTLWLVFTAGHTPGLVREHTSSAHSSQAAILCRAHAFNLSRMGGGSHRPSANEFTYLWGFVFLLEWMWSFFLWVLLHPLQLQTPHFNVNISLVKHSETWHFFGHFFPCLCGLTGCDCLGIIIIISGIWAVTGFLTHAISSIYFLGEETNREEWWNRRIPKWLILSLLSHLCTLPLLVFKRSLFVFTN